MLFCDFGFEDFSGFECRDFVFGDDDGGVLGDVTGGLLCPDLADEAAKPA